MDIDKLKALALATTPGPWRASQNDVFAGPRYRVCQNVTAGGSSKGMADERQWQIANAAFIAACREAMPELIAEVERLRARFEYIEEHATTQGGGKGFTITCFVPADHEDIGCGIDEAIAATPAPHKEETND